MKYPVVKNTDHWPTKPLCPVCKERKVFEPHSFAVLNGGALKGTLKSAGPASDLYGFLGLIWHGAHDGGEGLYDGQYEMVPLADNAKDGQFEMYFCSTGCLRKFLNGAVDELESQMIRGAVKKRRKEQSDESMPRASRRAVNKEKSNGRRKERGYRSKFA